MRVNLYQIVDGLNDHRNPLELESPLDGYSLEPRANDTRSRLAADLEGVIWMTDDGSWSHRGRLTANDKIPNDRDTAGLNDAAIKYFTQQEVQRDDLDWFYLDCLLYYSSKRMLNISEKVAADQFAGAFTHGIKMIVEGRIGMGLLFISGKCLKWLVLAFLIFLPFSSRGEPGALVLSSGAIAYILLTGMIRGREYSNARSKVFDRIWAANQAYSAVDVSARINWQLLASEVEQARIRGVPWLDAIHVAVRCRLG